MNASQSKSTLASSSSANNRLVDAWYQKSAWLWLLSPISLLFYVITTLRRLLLQSSFIKKNYLPVPVIVVGNISVGGTGKTPLIIALCDHLKKQGYRPGVISRGYGSAAPFYPFIVNEKSSVEESGDEPLMIAMATQCPVVIDRDRCSAAKTIIENCNVNVILSDDGLQHYRLERDIEIIVVDGSRGFGNGLLLPAGPLRETVNRLKKADFIISNEAISVKPINSSVSDSDVSGLEVSGLEVSEKTFNTNSDDSKSFITHKLSMQKNYTTMKVIPEYWCNLNATQRKVSIKSDLFSNEKINAVSGIGNPQRFYSTLDTLTLNYKMHSFPDHHQYSEEDLLFEDDSVPVVMTEKDAVKVRNIIPKSKNNYWYLAVEAEISASFLSQLQDKLSHIRHKKSLLK